MSETRTATNEHFAREIERQRILMWEGRVIIQLHRLAGVNLKLTKQLANGAVDSELKAVSLDLHNIANCIEKLRKEKP